MESSIVVTTKNKKDNTKLGESFHLIENEANQYVLSMTKMYDILNKPLTTYDIDVTIGANNIILLKCKAHDKSGKIMLTLNPDSSLQTEYLPNHIITHYILSPSCPICNAKGRFSLHLSKNSRCRKIVESFGNSIAKTLLENEEMTGSN